MLRMRGSSMEFDSLREYTVDDELRRIDWAATARGTRPVVRTYRAERNQTVLVLVDCARTMAARVGIASSGPQPVSAPETPHIPRLEHAMDAAQAITRLATGLGDRVGMIIAVLEKRAEYRLAAEDVFVNVVGGVKVAEPAIDLAIALAIASAHANRPLSPGTFAIGELGLGGEVRMVPQLEVRLREAARLGFGHAIVPHIGGKIPKLGGMALHEIRRLSQALALL